MYAGKLLAVMACLGAVCVCPRVAPAQTKLDRTVVLDSAGFWRAHFTYRTPLMKKGQDLVKLTTVTGDTPLPPDGWAAAEFDDGNWPRMPGFLFPAGNYNRPLELRNAGYTENEPTTPNLALICLRGKFTVTDPAAVKDLKLAVAFRGGLVAYLNGKEIARAKVPDSKDGLEAMADEYPAEAYLKPDGSVLGAQYLEKKIDDPELLRRWALRARRCELSIPAGAIVKGVNVLALEIHRAAYPPELLENARKVEFYLIPSAVWSTCALLTARLDAAGDAGLGPNVTRPKGFQIWNSSPTNPDYDLDWGDPNEGLAPIRLVGPRHGSVSGKVVCGSDKPLKGLSASITDLTDARGGKVSVTAVSVRYARADGWEQPPLGSYTLQPALFDGLSDAPPAEVPIPKKAEMSPWFLLPGQIRSSPGAVVPVWVTVHVPKDAAPGDYKGRLTISADGASPVHVPVELQASPWIAPDPADFHTIVELIQSAESVALQYGVEPYSDEHFKLLEKSFEQLAYVGNWTLYIPLIAQSNLGNEQTMVRWVKQPDGSWTHDFGVMERYLDLAEKYLGKPKIVVLYVWDLHIGGAKTHHQDLKVGGGGLVLPVNDVPVSQLDLATGKVTLITLPTYGDATKADWKALADGVMARLKKRGLDGNAQLGLGSDGRPTPQIIAFLGDVFDHLPWARGGHYEWREMGNSKEPVGLQNNVYPYKLLDNPAKGKFSCFGWNRPETRTLFVRTYEPAYPVTITRLLPEISTVGAQRGLGRMGLDFWPVLPAAKPNLPRLSIHGRYPNSNWAQLDAMIKAFVPPGPGGATSSAHLEALREGLQEAEARIVIERALTDKSLRAKLSDDLAGRCQQLLDDRARCFLPNSEQISTAGFSIRPDAARCLNGWENYAYCGVRSILFFRWFQHSGWQDRTAQLYNLAAQVTQATR